MSSESDESDSFISVEDCRPNRSRKKSLADKTMSKMEYSSLEIYNADDDELSLRYAAANSRLPFNQLSSEELKYFADVAQSRTLTNLYLYLRNRCLNIWHIGPQIQLTYEAFKDYIKSPLKSDLNLLERIHAFLERHCYINYGLFRINIRKSPTIRRKIIVIGAGYAGLMAALQLKYFGFEVLLLEGRIRTGGRVMTYQKHDVHGYGDLGGMIVRGIVGNPITTIVQQSPIRLVQMDKQSPIYERHGENISREKDIHIYQAFVTLLDTCSYISKELKINSLNGKPLSLGKALDLICNQMQLRVQRRLATFWSKLHSFTEKQQKLFNECYALGNDIKRLQAEIDIAIKNNEEYLFEIDIHEIQNMAELNRLLELRCYRRDLKIAIEKFKEKTAKIDLQRKHYKDVLKLEPCYVYMNSHDKAIVNFHKANLEYAKGCPLDKLSLEYWDADEEWGFYGPNCVIKSGHGKVTKIISDAVRDITKLSHSVTNIEIIDGGVKIKGIQKEIFGKPEFEETAAAVICTLPLGVLKYSVEKSNAAKDNQITFTPPLPKWKTKAIKNMGFGSLNKVMLVFKKPFWKTEDQIFSRISSTAESQGECFKFFVVPNEPVLIAILSGEAANNVDDINLKRRTMNFLRSTFPYCPKEPLEFIITRWHNDIFSRGCFSYISVDAQDRDHEVLGEPICDAQGIPRIFFGGEHTISRWPSTVHGAMISGMREATRVADTFYGTLPIVAPEIEHASICCEDEDVRIEEEKEESDIDIDLSDDDKIDVGSIDEKEAEQLLS